MRTKIALRFQYSRLNLVYALATLVLLASFTGCGFITSKKDRAELLAKKIEALGGEVGVFDERPDAHEGDEFRWWFPGAITQVSLSNIDLTEVDFASLLPTDTLLALALVDCELSSAQLESLTQCERLADLDLSFSSIDDDAVPIVAQITTLSWVNFRGCDITDEGIKILEPIGSLSLGVNETNVSDGVIARMQAMHPDRYVVGCGVPNKACFDAMHIIHQGRDKFGYRCRLRNETRFGNGKMIIVEFESETIAGLDQLQILSQYVDLSLIIDSAAQLDHCTKLDRVVEVTLHTDLDEAAFEKLTRFPLQSLSVGYIDDGVVPLLNEPQWKTLLNQQSLKYLSISSTEITAPVWQAISSARRLQHLETWDARFEPVDLIDSESLDNGFATLNTFECYDCEGISRKAIEQFQSRHPTVEVDFSPFELEELELNF